MMTEHDLGGKIKINKDDASDLIIRSKNCELQFSKKIIELI